jgi:hypothetical protein
MRSVCLAAVFGLLFSARLQAVDGDAKQWLSGRWAPAPAAGAVEKKSGPETNPVGKPRVKMKAKARRQAVKKVAEDIPKLVIEFTKDGKVLLDGDPSTLGDTFRVIKPLAVFPMKFAPQNKYLKINYQFTHDAPIEVSADHSWLIERLSAGATAISPAKARELDREYRPRETLRVVATSKELKLTNEHGKSVAFHRYAGDSLDVAEGKRREADLRSGLKPLEAILRQQGINTGAPADGKPADKQGARP